MKIIFLTITLIIGSTCVVNAQEKNAVNATDSISSERIKVFTKNICESAVLFRSTTRDRSGYLTENIMLTELQITRETPNYKQQVADFWNEYAHCFICETNGPVKTRNPEHFLKRVVSLGMYNTILYDFLLYDEDEYPIDVNMVEVYNGERETILDYVDKILADPNVSSNYNIAEIRDLRGTLIEDYNAKKAIELEE